MHREDGTFVTEPLPSQVPPNMPSQDTSAFQLLLNNLRDTPFVLEEVRKLVHEVKMEELCLAGSPTRTIGCASWDHPVHDLCAFLFPKGKSLPLHDHPNMSALIKILRGRLHVRAFDWVVPKVERTGQMGLAWLVRDEEYDCNDEPLFFTANEGGVVHQLTAVDEEAAMFDILTPGYEVGGVDCTYYSEQGPFTTPQDLCDNTQGAIKEVSQTLGVTDLAAAEALFRDDRSTHSLYFLTPARHLCVPMTHVPSDII